MAHKTENSSTNSMRSQLSPKGERSQGTILEQEIKKPKTRNQNEKTNTAQCIKQQRAS